MDCIFNISKYDPIAGSSYIKLPKELNHLKKGLFSIQNIDDNQSFKRSLVRYLHHVDYNPRTIRKVAKLYGYKLDSPDIKFQFKVKDIHKIERKNPIGFSVFGYEDKKKCPSYVSKKCFENKHVDFLLIGEGEKSSYQRSQRIHV